MRDEALDRALQPVGELNGYDNIEQFQTAALRYQINNLAYALGLARATRTDTEILQGASTRAADSLCAAVRALAALDGRDYAIPDDVQRLVSPVLSHRVVLKRGASDLEQSRKALERVVVATPVPL